MNEKSSRRAIDGKVKRTFHACAQLARIISVRTNLYTYIDICMRGIHEITCTAPTREDTEGINIV